jgi:hypothetical protein
MNTEVPKQVEKEQSAEKADISELQKKVWEKQAQLESKKSTLKHAENAIKEWKEKQASKEFTDRLIWEWDAPQKVWSLLPKTPENTPKKTELWPIISEEAKLQQSQEKAREWFLQASAEALKTQMDAVEATRDISILPPEKQKIVHTEIIRKALDPTKIPEEYLNLAKKEVLPPNGGWSLSPEQETKSKEIALQKWAEHEQAEYAKRVEADNKQTPLGNTASEYLKGLDQKLQSAITLDALKKKTPLSDVEKNSVKSITMEQLAEQAEKNQDFIDFTQILDNNPELQKKINKLMHWDGNKKFDFKTLYTDPDVRKKLLEEFKKDSMSLPGTISHTLSLDQGKFAEEIHAGIIQRLEEGNVDSEERNMLKWLGNKEINALLEKRDMPTFDGETALQITERVLHEDALRDIIQTVWPEADWTQMPDMIKQFATTNGHFRMPKDATKKHHDDQGKGVSLVFSGDPWTTLEESKKYTAELKKYAGFENQEAVKNTLKKAEPELSRGVSFLDKLPKWLAAIIEFIASLWAALWSKEGKELLAKIRAEKSTRDIDNSDRYNARSSDAQEYSWEIWMASPELAQNGFKWDVMNSIFRWEYQKWHDVEVVPAWRSGLTLCWGIDLAYTSFTKVKEIFAGILKPETIQRLRPFCYNGHTWPTRDRAESELWSAFWLKQEIQSQFTLQNMSLAFTRSLAIDWGRLLAQHGNAIKDAPWYVQAIMLSRFYHDGSGGSSDFIRTLQKTSPPFNHESLISLLNARINRRPEEYYGNRIRKEIAYAQKKPLDTLTIAQNPV